MFVYKRNIVDSVVHIYKFVSKSFLFIIIVLPADRGNG